MPLSVTLTLFPSLGAQRGISLWKQPFCLILTGSAQLDAPHMLPLCAWQSCLSVDPIVQPEDANRSGEYEPLSPHLHHGLLATPEEPQALLSQG